MRQPWPILLLLALCIRPGAVWAHGFDGDGDGWIDDVDCDDEDATIFPGAEDLPYDGIDSDCQHDDDFDLDQDGHVPKKYIGQETYPDFWNEFGELPGGDCNDRNPDIHPGAEEIFDNGIDENCDGIDAGVRGCAKGAWVILLFPAWFRIRTA